ncbi:MAG: hypothetical protein HY796_13355 [Elusimicrobia bacterium]|nr:hypothetical protein [Elusimicrobiota bacterium]
MKMMIVFPVLLALGLNLGAQPGESAPDTVQKNEPAAAKSPVKNAKQSPLAANEEKKPPQPQKKEPANAGAEQEGDEGSVMIDSRADEDYAERPKYAKPRYLIETEESNAPDGMPASYGQLKGAFNDGGRSILVFENEEGVMAFVQVFVGKNAVSWKLISRIRRSGD